MSPAPEDPAPEDPAPEDTAPEDPAPEESPSPPYPVPPLPVNHIEPVPRRIRAVLAGVTVLDTLRARYVWEWPPYPQFYIPLADVAPGVLVDEDHPQRLSRGTARRHALEVAGVRRPSAARVYGADALSGLVDYVRFEWDALDAWYEEDEQVYVHPRSPYARVDALRSSRPVRIELDGVVLAEAASSVVVFETGLPPRHYVDRTALCTEHLEPSSTVTACPYKGTTGGYWSARVGGRLHADLAWSYTFPTRELLPIAGLVAFYDERVDLFVDGVRQPRPRTPFSPRRP